LNFKCLAHEGICREEAVCEINGAVTEDVAALAFVRVKRCSAEEREADLKPKKPAKPLKKGTKLEPTKPLNRVGWIVNGGR
jgi:hypothetical protein